MTCGSLGLVRLRPLPVTLPLEQIVDGLNDYQPDVLHAFASYGALLADEQLAGRLRIAPRVVTTSSELLTPGMARRIEAVDRDGLPVPAGAPGARLLITNLFNRAEPLIRYEIPDTVTMAPKPCPCGRTLARIRNVHGRTDDVLVLDGVTVHPLQFSALAADGDVREFQVVQRGDRLTVRIVPTVGADVAALAGRLAEQIGAGLRALGLADPKVEIEACQAIERPHSGKLQLVVADDHRDRASGLARVAARGRWAGQESQAWTPTSRAMRPSRSSAVAAQTTRMPSA